MGAWAGFLLAIVFVFAAISKFRDPKGTENSVATLGLPFPKLLSSLLPTVELLCAVLLAIDPRSGGPCAVALLVAFTTLLVAQILSGNPQNCACFGSWSSKKISSWDLLRNAILITLGVLATLN
ncbi:MAG: MauE/DoxX family redox-associated membrane protein [Actinomycetota bacterium]|nr:MauE/DoxX family redox-associated membrane protein [Actinomycetota bacterium]